MAMRFSHRHKTNRRRHGPAPSRGPVAIAAIAAMFAFGVGAAPSLADTGSVYYDAHNNVGAGYQLFNGTLLGYNNVGIGYSVMPSLTIGSFNVATGNEALRSSTLGVYNVAIGSDALYRNTSGSSNVALGSGAGYLTTGSKNVDMASSGAPDESGTIRIGDPADQTATYLAGVYTSTGSGKPVVVDSNGKLGAQSVTSMLNSSSVVDRLRARLGNVRGALRARLGQVRARLREKVQDLELRDRELAHQIQQIRDQLRGG